MSWKKLKNDKYIIAREGLFRDNDTNEIFTTVTQHRDMLYKVSSFKVAGAGVHYIRYQVLRWLALVSITSQHLRFDGSIVPLFIS